MNGKNSKKWSPGIRVRAVQPLDGFRLRLTFSDSSIREIDLDPYLHGTVFEPLRADRNLFRAVRIYPEGDTIYWPNGADIAPETLYEESKPVQLPSSPDLKSVSRGATSFKAAASSPRAGTKRQREGRTRQTRMRG